MPNILTHSTAVCTGYLVWLLLHTHLPITQQYHAELSFFNLPDTQQVDSPETVKIALRAPRATLDTITPVMHIDAQALPLETSYPCHLDHKNLLVPYQVDMVYCYPSVISITKTEHHTLDIL